MLKDKTNIDNIKMILLSILAFFICIILVIVMGVVFGNHMYDPMTHTLDIPIASMEYHDHRVDFSDSWVYNTTASVTDF